MKIFRIIWKIIFGGAVTAAGWYMAAPQMGETALTGSAVIGIALLAVGVSVLAAAFEGGQHGE